MRTPALLALLLLAGCMTPAQIDQMNYTASPPSAATRAALVQAARDYLVDPYSVRDAEISGELVLNAQRNIRSVCAKFNSRNRMGGYTGRDVIAIRLTNGVPSAAFEGQAACRQSSIRWYPFPELEALRDI